ncbi:MAG: hypothetical protein ACJ76Z_12465 [Thermoleophilaceae bacterium]
MEEVAQLGKSYAVAFSWNVDRVVAVGGATRVVSIDIGDERVRWSRSFRNGAHLTRSPTGIRIVALNTSGGGIILDGETFDLLAQTSGAGIGEGPAAVFGPDDTVYVQASWAGDLLLRDSATGDVLYRERRREDVIHALSANPAGTLLAEAVSRDVGAMNVVVARAWPFDASEPNAILCTRPNEPIDAVAVRDDESAAVLVGSYLRLYSLCDGEILAERPWKFPGTDRVLSWAPRRDELVTVERQNDEQVVIVLDSNLSVIAKEVVPYACAASYSPDGALLTVGSWESGRVFRR